MKSSPINCLQLYLPPWSHLGEDGALSEAGLQRLEHGGDGLQLGAGELVRVVRDAVVNLNTHSQLPLLRIIVCEADLEVIK